MKLPFLLMLSLEAISSILTAETESSPHRDCFNVRNFGAVGDGMSLDSPAINKAIEAAANQGGGTVLVPAGIYLSGSIRLKNNIHLLIDAGATVLGAPQKMNSYDETEPFPGIAYQDGGHTYFHNSLIWGENLTNVSITGNGLINGGGLVRDARILDEMSGSKRFQNPSTNVYPPVRIGNKTIALKLCKNVLIRDITVLHAGHFAILATACDNLTIDNVTIDSNRDGIDIDCCRDAMVSNCRVNTPEDDAICLKSTCALGEIRVTENLTIANCQVFGFKEGTFLDGTMKGPKGHGRIKFGTESSGGFRNCTVSNCTFRSCRGLALEEVDGGIMENIAVNNISMVDVLDYGIYITTGSRNRSPGPVNPSRARNILISDVIIDGVDKMSGIQIWGLPNHPVQDIRLENIRLTSKGGGTALDAAINPKELGNGYPDPSHIGTLPAYGIYARHVKGLELANIVLDYQSADARPAAMFSDIEGLEISNFKPQTQRSVKTAVFADNVNGITIRDSPGIGLDKQ